MASGEDAEKDERRFDPTEKRKRQFREEGKVAVSRDLAGAVQLAAIVTAFVVVGNGLVAAVTGSLTWVFSHVGDKGGQGLEVGEVVSTHLTALLPPTLILCGILLVATLVGYIAQTGLLFNFSQVAPNFGRLNPAKKLADLFSPKNFFVKSGLTIAKLGLATFAVTLVLAGAMPRIATLGMATLETTTHTLTSTLSDLLIITVSLLAVVAAVDFIWQKRKISSEMKMTKEEVKKESEEEEGKPEIKHKRRQKHRELSLNRIMKEVPTADVVLTNPTHYAVALRYQPGKDKAPVVVAKGADDLAAIIRKVAREHGVPILENRALARALFSTVKVGRPVPSNFFQAVAQVLAKVYKARRERGIGRAA